MRKKALKKGRYGPKLLGEHLQTALQMFRNSATRGQVYNDLKERGLAEDRIRYILQRAEGVLQEYYDQEASILVQLHIRRYDEMIKEHMDPDLSNIPRAAKRSVEIDHLTTALDALQSKERLLGFHTPKLAIQINNLIEVNMRDDHTFTRRAFAFKNMSIEEKRELKALLDKARVPDEDHVEFEYKESELEEIDVGEYIDYEEIAPSALRKVTTIKSNREQRMKGRTLKDVQKDIDANVKQALIDKLKNKKSGQ